MSAAYAEVSFLSTKLRTRSQGPEALLFTPLFESQLNVVCCKLLILTGDVHARQGGNQGHFGPTVYANHPVAMGQMPAANQPQQPYVPPQQMYPPQAAGQPPVQMGNA